MHYKKHLSRDKSLKQILHVIDEVKLVNKKTVYEELTASIISQQLSTKVARVIHQRFLSLFENEKINPQAVIDIDFEKLRGVGMSNAKATYVKEVARFAIEKGIHHKHISKLSDDEIVEYLTQIKGVGRWTVEMMLIFTLGREDVFAVDDLGIQQAMIHLYKIKTTDKKKLRLKMLKIAETWQPYRTYACLYLWKWYDEKKKK